MNVGKLVDFDGRIGRGAFWLIVIVNYVVLLLGLLLVRAGGLVVVLGAILILIGFVISLSAQFKRWHDRDKSGWWVLISLVPIIGGLWAFIETGFLSGTAGPNSYGIGSGGSPFASS
jgi:uncharacterized membrane protein YhaH (DUF805 family)